MGVNMGSSIFGFAQVFEQRTSHESENIRSSLNAKTTNKRMAALEILQFTPRGAGISLTAINWVFGGRKI